MKIENGHSAVDVESKSCETSKCRTRMKKVAPPPPPPPIARAPPPLSNGMRRVSTPGEDCAFDEMLEGRMDLEVVLPDCKVVRTTVDRRTPMMDLLVQISTTNRISPGDHLLNVISQDERNLPYKPNTPIGSLDASTVYVIPKSALDLPVKRMPKLANQPFEQPTFRLQVNLPHNQRMVLRVSPRITLAQLKQQICLDKELDHAHHHLVHPTHTDTLLDLNATLDLYACAEITLMSDSGLRDSIRSNIFPGPKIEEERKKKGILRLFSRKKKDFQLDTTNGSHGLSSSRSENSLLPNRNNTGNSYQPKQSIKRKPAPAPPPASPPLISQSTHSLNSRPESEISTKTVDDSSISHSRHSSDSSGYHEPSVFSDCSAENKSPEASIVSDPKDGETLMKPASMTATNLKNVPSCSNVSIVSASRKRKAPQPPVSTLPAIESPSSPVAEDTQFQGSAKTQTDISSDTQTDISSTQTDILSSTQRDISSEISSNNIQTNISRHQSDMTQTDEFEDQFESADQLKSVDQLKSPPDEYADQPAESEAIQYLENVLQESENCVGGQGFCHSSRMMMQNDDDSDSDRDEQEVISVCQAEVHAHPLEQDSSDSVVDPPTVVTPAMPNPSNSQPAEQVNEDADDSGISQSLTSDADSSVPSLHSDTRTDSCLEELYCNVSSDSETNLVPSSDVIQSQEMMNTVDGLVSESPEDNSLDETSNDKTYIDEGTAITPQTDTPEEENCCTSLGPDILPDVDVKQPNLPVTSPQPEELSNHSPVRKNEPKCDTNSDKISVSSSLSSDCPTPPVNRKLENFALGCYQRAKEVDIYSLPSPEHEQSFISLPCVEREVPLRQSRNKPVVRIVSFKQPSDNNSRSNVLEKCAQLSKTGTLPLTGRSSSLLSLTPQIKPPREFAATVTEGDDEYDIKRTHSDQNLALETVEETFLQEQRRLQEEYRRLQEQFISWQEQLMSNQNLLQSEKIVPQMPFPSFEGLTTLESSTSLTAEAAYGNTAEKEIASRDNYNDLKTRSLPRPKTKPMSLKEPSMNQTPPLSQPVPPVAATIVDIDINSHECTKRPESLLSRPVEPMKNLNQEDKVTQIPSPQDKNTQVPSPQEKVTSGTQAPSPENVLNKDTSAQTSEILHTSSSSDVSNSLSSPESEVSKSQTLPRPKSKPSSALQQPSRTMTLNRNTRSKPQAVSVTIGSWQQRQTGIPDAELGSSVASTRSKFMSLESIIPPQETIKPTPAVMEKRKLPPVPSETDNKPSRITVNPVTEPKARIKVTSVTKPESHDKKISSKTTTPTSETTKVMKTIPKQLEEVTPKSEIKQASREPTATFKLAKPFVKMTSMKDEFHTPSIIGLRKWPLTEISESHTLPDGKQSFLDDLRASSKKPGGYVQEKIRRAEVDLRKPKPAKTASEPAYVPKPSATASNGSAEASSKPHITQITINPKHCQERKTISNPKMATTVPKSRSLNSELLSVFSSRKASRDSEEQTQVKSVSPGVTLNGSPPPPPPPPPVMPTIPPAEQIPVSSQLLMGSSSSKKMKKSPSKLSRASDPREELMLEIRGFGGKTALRKAPSTGVGWNLRVFGASSTVNTT